MSKLILILTFVAASVLVNCTTNVRPVSRTLLKKQTLPSNGGIEKDDLVESNELTERNTDELVDNEEQSRDAARWRREEDWNKADIMVEPDSQDPLLTRQEDFDRWLRKRGSSPVEEDPDAARVASKQGELQELLQQLYEAQAAVKMETGEVSRTQQVAQEAQAGLEEATNKVRMLSADLQAAQEAAAASAMRAHTAQLQLSAHDQLMFTARQRVDALSAQMVSVQADLASAQQAFTLNNSSHLLEAQGRGMEVALQPDKMMVKALSPRRSMFPADLGPNVPLSPALISAAISPTLLEEKHSDSVPPSMPFINRQNYNYMFPQ